MNFSGWWFDVKHDQSVFACAPPKCGLTSLQVAMVPGLAEVVANADLHIGEVAMSYASRQGIGPYDGMEVFTRFPKARKVMSVREPVARFVSMWKWLCKPELGGHPTFGIVAGKSPDEMMDFVEAFPFGNEHWAPQRAFLIPGAEVVDISRFLPSIGYPQIHANKSEPGEVQVPVDRIRKHYIHDVELWERANEVA